MAPDGVAAPAGIASPSADGALTHSALTLWRTGSRVVWLLAGAGLFLLALLGSIGVAADNTSSTATRVAIGVVGGLIALRLLAGTVQGFRAAFGDTPYLELHPELGVRLHDKILMREPIEIPRAALRAGAVEGPPRRRRTLGSALTRFPVEGTGAWCWGAWEGSRLPKLGHARDIPNFVLVLREPIPAPRVRHGNRTWMLGHPPHGRVRRGEPLGGLLFTVRDPELAQRALDTWGLAEPLRPADLDPVEPAPPSRRRQARFAHYAVAAFVVWIGLNALAGFGVFG